MTHIYYVKKWHPDRFKMPCKILARGRNGNRLIEFEDGFKMIVAGRFAVRGVR